MNTPPAPLYVLPAIGILAELVTEHRAFLASYGRFLRPSTGEILISAGGPQDSLYLIISGTFHVALESGGRPVLLAKLGEGDSMGEINLFDPAAASETVVARDYGLVWCISRCELESFLEAYPEAGVRLLRGLLCTCSNRIRKMNRAMAQASATNSCWGLAGMAAPIAVLASREKSEAARLSGRPTPEAGHKMPRHPADRENDHALEGGDEALREFPEESTLRIATAEETAARLQSEVAAARAAGEAAGAEALELAKRKIGELEAGSKAAATTAAQTLQQTRQEAAATQAAMERLRRDLDAAAERFLKAEEQAAKAVAMARAEGEKQLQQQAGELEKTRQSLTKLTARKEELEHEVAVDATAFAPRRLSCGSPFLVRLSVHQHRDFAKVVKAAAGVDENMGLVNGSEPLGEIRRGSEVKVVLSVTGAACDDPAHSAIWNGVPRHFTFAVRTLPDDSAKQAVFQFRVLVDQAQVGMISFVRPIGRSWWDWILRWKAAGAERLRRVERVFISYTTADREMAASVAGAYQRVGITCFFDRSSLESGEEWASRLFKEIERADLFHLFWSVSASRSDWVEKEALHALSVRKRTGRRCPNITIQMLDGPPWAPHPASLDELNFDDYGRAAVSGYAISDPPSIL